MIEPPDVTPMTALPPAEEAASPVVTGVEPQLLLPATFRRRASAFLIDFILINMAYLVLLAAAVAGLTVGLRYAQQSLPSQELVLTLVEGSVSGWSLFFLGYMALFTARGGQTPGKMAVQIRVVRVDGASVTWLLALWRAALCYASLLFFPIFAVAGLPPQKRALHDYLATTKVVTDRHP